MKPQETQDTLPQPQSRASRDGETPVPSVPGVREPRGPHRAHLQGPSLLPALSRKGSDLLPASGKPGRQVWWCLRGGARLCDAPWGLRGQGG